ncbi:MAG: transglutaminase domain-containing protein [Candidatus Aminicenantes bacterium]|nr:MAG: transglutaminase domain-containing protein [Candidatus Aminicenantes bacterium]
MKSKLIVILLLVLTIFVFFTATSGFAQSRDYWLKTQRKGTGFSYEHITIQKLENGNIEYHIDRRAKMDLVGQNPQDMIQVGTYIVDADLRPISLDFHVQFEVKKAHISGEYKDGLLQLAIEDEEGKVIKREIPFEETYFDVVLADVILKRESEKIFTLKIFDPVEVTVSEAQIEITGADRTGVAATVTDLATSKYRIDRQGRIRNIEHVELHMQAYLTDAGDAQNIDYLNTADGYTLTVRSQKTFPNVYNVVKAQVQVKWTDIPFEKFNFEDNRQKMAKQTSSDDEYEVILEFTRPTAPSVEIETPIQDEKFAPFLEETEYIKPNDPSIQQQLSEIRMGELDAKLIVQNILQWIKANIKTDLILETLSGPEVLEKKRGKCSEFAIIFASLARAAGIPTKIALGEVNQGNLWLGHMWNEVWLEGWIAVDPSAGIFVAGPSHLKFIDSPTVMGTQDIRWKLVDNLSIEILDFEEEESETIEEIETGIFNHTYFNKTFSCKISAPDNSWSLNETEKGGVAVVEINSEEKGVEFALVLFAVPQGTSAKVILDGRMNAVSRMVQDFEKHEEGEVEIAGQKAPRAVFQQSRKDESIIFNENCLLIDGTNAYLFAFITVKESFAELRPLFLKILESFEILK